MKQVNEDLKHIQEMSQSDDKGKEYVVIAYLIVLTLFGAVIGSINTRQSLVFIGVYQIIISIYYCVTALIYRKTKSQKFINITLGVITPIFALFEIGTGGNQGIALFWQFLTIPAIFYIMDMKWAFIVNYLRVILVITLMWIPYFRAHIFPYRSVTIMWYPIIYALTTIICHIIQHVLLRALEVRDENMELAIRINERLQEQIKMADLARQEAEYANRAKSQFLSNMSHDIRTPMNAIVGYTAIASAHVDDRSKVSDCLSKIAQSSDHLQGLINDVLDMSRIEAGKERLNVTKTSLPDMIKAVIPMIQSQLERKNLELFIDTMDLKDELVYADTQKMRQILINILGNAVKFTNAGGSIGIRIRQQKYCKKQGYASYTLTIKDTGIGMSEEFVSHVFDPFSQERTDEQGRYSGTGLGMSITKNFVEMMGGTIRVKSELGKGTEFTINVDLKLQEDQKVDQRLEQLKGFRVLVVDDDFQTCNSVSHMLQDVGMRADWSTSAKDALQRVEVAHEDGDSFFAYIIDWIMPVTNGIELTRKIRKIVGDEVPIIILTAYSWADVEQEAREAGVTALCTKPLFVSDLTKVFLDNISGVSSEKKAEVKREDVHFNGQRVLLAEDNRMNREIATIQLEEMGLQVISVNNGQQAVDAMEQCSDGYYDIVLMDIRMPLLNGMDACRKIRASSRSYLQQIPIIALTANAFSDDVKACLAAGMNEHVSKPMDVEQLAIVLEKYL